ncbi:hypothetical protein MRX96_001689 [Rhipicephalus microplus]
MPTTEAHWLSDLVTSCGSVWFSSITASSFFKIRLSDSASRGAAPDGRASTRLFGIPPIGDAVLHLRPQYDRGRSDIPVGTQSRQADEAGNTAGIFAGPSRNFCRVEYAATETVKSRYVVRGIIRR